MTQRNRSMLAVFISLLGVIALHHMALHFVPPRVQRGHNRPDFRPSTAMRRGPFGSLPPKEENPIEDLGQETTYTAQDVGPPVLGVAAGGVTAVGAAVAYGLFGGLGLSLVAVAFFAGLAATVAAKAEERAAAERLAEEKANAPKRKPALQRWLDEQPVMGPVCGALSAVAMAAVYSLAAQQPLWGVVVVVAAIALVSSFMESAPVAEQPDATVTPSESTAMWSIFDRRRSDTRFSSKKAQIAAETVPQSSAPTQHAHSGHSEGKHQNQLYDVFRHLGTAPKEDEAVTVA